jgi:hypothetical protein
MLLNLQELLLYNNTSKNEYFLAATAIDDSARKCMMDILNVHIILETIDGKRITIGNEDIKVICLGNMYNKMIGEKYTLFRFNIIIDNSASINSESFVKLQQVLKRFIELIPLVFEAQVIKFSENIQLKTGFTKNKKKLINAINKTIPQGGTALYDAIDLGMQELKNVGDEIPLRFSIILTDGKDNSSKNNPDPIVFKQKIIYECRKNLIPIFIVGVSDSVDSQLLTEIAKYGVYQHVKSFPDLDKAFHTILELIKDTYIFKIPAVEDFSKLKTIYIVKRTPGGNIETIQDFIVR